MKIHKNIEKLQELIWLSKLIDNSAQARRISEDADQPEILPCKMHELLKYLEHALFSQCFELALALFIYDLFYYYKHYTDPADHMKQHFQTSCKAIPPPQSSNSKTGQHPQIISQQPTLPIFQPGLLLTQMYTICCKMVGPIVKMYTLDIFVLL